MKNSHWIAFSSMLFVLLFSFGCDEDEIIIPMCQCRADQVCVNAECMDSSPDIAPVPEEISKRQ